MTHQKFPHILLPEIKQTQSYKPKAGGSSSDYSIPDQIPAIHGNVLKNAYSVALQSYQLLCEQNGIKDAVGDKGFAIEVNAPEGIGLEYIRLENKQGKEHIEVLNVKYDENGVASSAVIYIPPSKKDNLSNKILDYQDESKKTKNGHPRNRELFNTIDNIVAAELKDFWADNLPFPIEDKYCNWELWLREGTIEQVRAFIKEAGDIIISSHHLCFPDRQICTIACNLKFLQKLQLATNSLTGFRYNRTQSSFFDSLEPREQKEWQENLAKRIIYNMKNSSVCLVDTGLRSEHSLLKPAIKPETIDTYHPDWGTDDHDGHGTGMGGLALLGDLTPILEADDTIEIQHYLESVKVFPPYGKNVPEHIGFITEQSIYRAETNAPKFDRVFCLSWTISLELDGVYPLTMLNGQPTALSAKIDQMAFAVDYINEWQIDDEMKRLFFISAGNIRDQLKHTTYLDYNDLSEIEEPAQSWNAITVGAYTNKIWVNDPNYDSWEPIAKAGELSPRSRTSVSWGKTPWPIKPDVVLEGGNHIGKDNFPPEDHPDLHVLTTGKQTPFCHSSDTSAANAQAARLGAIIRAEYPHYWPETVRGLIVHSARWTDAMLAQAQTHPINNANMQEKINLLRRFGYGVPNEEFLLNSFKNKPCLIIQDYLKPFKLSIDELGHKKGSDAIYDEMNFYELPWPKEQLEQLFDQKVTLRATLSYFIEPSPSELPPKTKHGYASHELRFKLKRANETTEAFLQRINAELTLGEEIDSQENINNSRGKNSWLLGPKTRDRGSLISDIWTGTGAELANQNILAIIPQGGWWKYRVGFPSKENPRLEQKVRYSLIISLECEADIDIYTPITQQIKIPVKIIV